jgi:hypothetical protein
MAHPELDSLYHFLLEQVQAHSHRGSFAPFGAAMHSDGSLSLSAEESPASEKNADPQTTIDRLKQTFKQAAARNELCAVGICVDVRTVPPGQTAAVDAICCSLEHISGEAVDVILPYKKNLFGQMHYGEPFAVEGKADVFGA